jgi:RNA polymerase sigma-70 factor (ECF subfamily)
MDVAGFERAAREHKDRVHAYAFQLLRDRAEAQDVSQEALVRLWQNRERVDALTARAWLVRTAHNLCIDRIRRRRVRSEVADGDEVVALLGSKAAGPDGLAAAGEACQGIRRALDELSERDRAVVLLREVHGLPYDEIAAIVGVPLGTLKARLHRARERLRGLLVEAGVTP